MNIICIYIIINKLIDLLTLYADALISLPANDRKPPWRDCFKNTQR